MQTRRLMRSTEADYFVDLSNRMRLESAFTCDSLTRLIFGR